MENDVVRYMPIKGAQKGRPAEVDLPGSTEIVLDGRYSLSEGDAVQVVRRGLR